MYQCRGMGRRYLRTQLFLPRHRPQLLSLPLLLKLLLSKLLLLKQLWMLLLMQLLSTLLL